MKTSGNEHKHFLTTLLQFDDDGFINMLNIAILQYADDAVLISNNAKDMQTMLNIFSDYCKTWKLDISLEKTKVVVFVDRRIKKYVIDGRVCQ